VITVGRVYVNRADRAHYKLLFDELQHAVEVLTKKPMRFQRLTRGGTILAMNVDLEAAQVLGAGDSFLKTNELEYSGIETNDLAELVEYFTKACHTHVKRYAVSNTVFRTISNTVSEPSVTSRT